MSKVTNFQHQIEIDKIACPLHVLKMKKGFDAIKEGETLKITSNAYVAPELLAAARQIAAYVEINENDEIFLSKGK